jgi:hypothetical protein
VASKSIRDRTLTGTRIPMAKRQTAIFLFADNVPATKVANVVGISLDSARGIRDREQILIMELKAIMSEEYLRLWEEDVAAYFNREAEKDYQQFWGGILKKQKALAPDVPKEAD